MLPEQMLTTHPLDNAEVNISDYVVKKVGYSEVYTVFKSVYSTKIVW